MKFDLVGNVAMAIMAHLPLFGSAVRFSHIQQQGKQGGLIVEKIN